MLAFFYILQIIIAILIVLLVLFQKNEGGTGLLSSNTYNSFFSNKSLTSNPLTKFTIILGVIFFTNAIIIGAINISKFGASNNSSNLIEEIKNTPVASTGNNKAVSSQPMLPSNQIPLGK